MHISLEDILALEKRYRTNLINSLAGFKSLNLIGTANEAGLPNLGLYSQVIHVGANPPLQGVLFRPAVVPRHTLENIYATRQFTLNHVTEDFYQKAHWSSARWEENEFEAVGLTSEFGEGRKAPYVKESRISALLEFQERHLIQTNQTTLVVGKVLELRIDDGLIQSDGSLDLETAGSLTVSGLDHYHKTQSIGKLSYAKPDEAPGLIGK